jgi:histone H3/H4
MPTAITRSNTVESYLKATLDLRISPESIDTYRKAIQQLADLLAHQAADRAKADQRTTLLDRDVTAALQAITGAVGKVDPPSIFAQIDQLPTDQVAQLINLVTAWLKNRP